MLAHYDDHDLVEVSRSLVIVFFPVLSVILVSGS